jgi:hypothetical protein
MGLLPEVFISSGTTTNIVVDFRRLLFVRPAFNFIRPDINFQLLSKAPSDILNAFELLFRLNNVGFISLCIKDNTKITGKV